MFERPLAAGRRVIGRAIVRGVLDQGQTTGFTTIATVMDDTRLAAVGIVLKAVVVQALDAIRRTVAATYRGIKPRRRAQAGGAGVAVGKAGARSDLMQTYEGVDERVRERVTEELSIGDYVLTGGELPAMVILDAVARLVPGVVGDEQSIADDSFSRGLLDFPQYTRPATLTSPGPQGSVDMSVPDVLLSGNHADIRRWRKREAVTRTLERRPDLLAGASLDDEEREILREISARQEKA